MTTPRTLAFFEPGHFHAALTLRVRNPRVANEVHLYATPGPDRDAFVGLVNAFNTRTHAPTAWEIVEHASDDPNRLLETLVDDKHAEAVILAGRNNRKGAWINRITANGIHVLADKPWVTNAASLPHIEAALTNPGLALDIMTSRFDVVAQLRRTLARDDSLFGGFRRQPDTPAIEMGSVHHLMKKVNGAPLRRPPWYYDVTVQGDGVVDIQTHMTDQAGWLVEGERPLTFVGDVSDLHAVRWPTHVPLELYQESTGLTAFAPPLLTNVRNNVLALMCNALVTYTLDGIGVRQHAEWRPVEPEGGGDLHHTLLRGQLAEIVVRQNEDTGYRAELHVRDHAHPDLKSALTATLKGCQSSFPGVHAAPSDLGYQVMIPDSIHTGHEEHFAMVLESFLDFLDAGRWPSSLTARLALRYTLLARAYASCTDQETQP